MIGTKYPSEKREYVDEKTGVKITQLTSNYINNHMYFTDNSFDVNRNEIYFLSNRANPEKEECNLFHMDLETGEMTQLTDEPEGIIAGCLTKTPDSKYFAYFSGNDLHLYCTETGENKVIYTEKTMVARGPSFSADRQWIGFTRNEDIANLPNREENYSGFKERLYGIKDARISMVRIDGTDFHDVYRDTHQLGHFQFSPDDNDIAMFCHEGPWNRVLQRIWIMNVKTREIWHCFRQAENDCVGHEFWLQNGDLLFDNRMGGHDGTITSNKEQLDELEHESTDTPWFGIAGKDGEVYRKFDMPFYCNHYHSNPDATLFVGDALEDIVLIKVTPDGEAKAKSLAVHNTTWRFQRSHCHPTFSWDGTKILYAADTDRWHDNIFLVDLNDLTDEQW